MSIKEVSNEPTAVDLVGSEFSKRESIAGMTAVNLRENQYQQRLTAAKRSTACRLQKSIRQADSGNTDVRLPTEAEEG
jgi:hypothetical protein